MAILDDGTYHGELEGRSPHGHGRMNYKNGDSYEGQWKDGFMTNGKYTNSELRESFEGTFIKNCPRKGTLSEDRNFLSNFEITCTESIEITQPACWVMMHVLRSKIEDGAIGALMDRKRADQNENMTKFKNKSAYAGTWSSGAAPATNLPKRAACIAWCHLNTAYHAAAVFHAQCSVNL